MFSVQQGWALDRRATVLESLTQPIISQLSCFAGHPPKFSSQCGDKRVCLGKSLPRNHKPVINLVFVSATTRLCLFHGRSGSFLCSPAGSSSIPYLTSPLSLHTLFPQLQCPFLILMSHKLRANFKCRSNMKSPTLTTQERTTLLFHTKAPS